jgi:hypothetical protein
MSAANVLNVIRAPGRLCINPTNAGLQQAFPHGGTALGLAAKIEFRYGYAVEIVRPMTFGRTVTEAVYGGEDAMLAATIRGLDPDMLAALLPNTTAGASSGTRTVKYSPGDVATNLPGYLLSNKQAIICFSPKALDTHPMILLYNAIPILAEDAKLSLSQANEIAISAVFLGTPDSSGRVYAHDRRENLSI